MKHCELYVQELNGKHTIFAHYEFEEVVDEVILVDGDGKPLAFDTEAEAKQYLAEHPYRDGNQLFNKAEAEKLNLI